MYARRWGLPIAFAAAATLAGARPAAAQAPEVEATGAVNVGYTQVSQSTFQADPMAEPGDVPEDSSSRLFSEIRPGIAIQIGRPRLLWRFAYQFSGIFALEGSPSYANQGTVALLSAPSKHTTLTLTALVGQGGTAFLQSQKPAESGQPELRAPGNPNVVSGTVTEALSWAAGQHTALQQSLSASASAPQDDLGQSNSSVGGALVLERLFKRFATGLEVRSTVSWLRPLQTNLEPYASVTNTLLARFRQDFSYRWNGLVTAGVEQVFSDSGSRPLALLPTGSITALYTFGDTAISADLSHGALTNIQVGTVSITDKVTARGVYTLDALKQRTLSFSTGFIHTEPIGESAALVAAGTGDAVSADVGFTTELMKHVLGTARYSLSYQFDQAAGLEPILAHIISIGVTATYGTTTKALRPQTKLGQRLDGSDRAFPVGGNPIQSDDRPPTSAVGGSGFSSGGTATGGTGTGSAGTGTGSGTGGTGGAGPPRP
ncbi:MAG TPA: hypothetical protein VNO30_21940 [Kofleriaceae bacterium]|nr:hypothetical protein [Kofleriaceae bacterium]